MGHCCSFDELHTTDISIMMEVLAKVDKYDTIVLTNIAPGLFLQLAAENADVNEETL